MAHQNALPDKAELRKEFGRLFQQMSEEERHQANLLIQERLHRYIKEFCRHSDKVCVMAYEPMRREVPVFDMLKIPEVELFLPLITGMRLRPVSVESGRRAPFHKIDLVITPGLFCTREGYRLGRGRGYYDRLLATFPRARTLFVGYDWQIIEKLPVDSWDRRVGAYLTDRGSSSCRFINHKFPAY